ncbi:MAG: hypothetical protein NXH80_03370 [Rhodobacteraceae bacterium]|nr:hypothetical protein [Paracoccaceae bacterium]
MNYMIADGLERADQAGMAERIRAGSVRLIEKSGFAEYHHPITVEPCGDAHFS